MLSRVPTELVVETEDSPGVIASIGEVLGQRHINIRAAAAFAHGGRGYLHFVVDDADGAIAAMSRAGWNVAKRREVLAVSLDDRPGELGRYARRLADAGVNISALYMASGQGGDLEVIVAVENLDAARRI